MLLDDLKSYLVAQGIATGIIQLGEFQPTPDTVLALRETGGFPLEHTMAGAAIMEEPTVQVVARAMNYQPAETLIRQVYRLLDGLRNKTINSVLYHWVVALQPPFYLDRDDNQRYVLAFNIHIKRETVA